MSSYWIYIRASLSKRRKQYSLLATALLLSTILLSSASQLLQLVHRPFAENFARHQASHLLLFFDGEAESYERIAAWARRQPEVRAISRPVPYLLFDREIGRAGERIELAAHLTEYIPQAAQDRLTVLSAEADTVPLPGEVWLPYHFATNFDLQVGDTLSFPFGGGNVDLVISSFVIDPHFLSGLFNPTRIWLAPGALSIYQPLDELQQLMVGLRLDRPEQAGLLYARLLVETGFSGSQLDYALFHAAFSGLFSLFGVVLLLMAALIFGAELLVLYGTLTSQIYADFREIGILKTLGYTPAMIRWVYVLKMVLISAGIIPLGLAVARLCIGYVLAFLNSSAGLDVPPAHWVSSYLLPGLLIAGLILLVTGWTTFRAGRVPAHRAIRSVDREYSTSGRRWIDYRRLAPVPMLAIQWLTSRRLANGILTISFTLLTFLMLLVAGITNALEQLPQHRAEWGLLDTDVQLKLDNSVFLPLRPAEFLDLLTPFLPRTERVVPFAYTELKFSVGPQRYEARGRIFDTAITETGLTNLRGTHPRNAGELALGISTARTAGVDVGDSILVRLAGNAVPMLITGIYQDIATFGHGMRLPAAGVRAVNPLFAVNQFGIRLADTVAIAPFEQALKSFFGEKIIIDESLEQRTAFLRMIANIRWSILFLSALFLLLFSLLVANDLHIHINRDRREIAKLKAIGASDRQIKFSFWYKTMACIALGGFLGAGLVGLVGATLVGSLTAGLGLPDFPFQLSPDLLGVVLPLLLGLVALVTWHSLRVIHRIPPYPKEMI